MFRTQLVLPQIRADQRTGAKTSENEEESMFFFFSIKMLHLQDGLLQ